MHHRQPGAARCQIHRQQSAVAPLVCRAHTEGPAGPLRYETFAGIRAAPGNVHEKIEMVQAGLLVAVALLGT